MFPRKKTMINDDYKQYSLNHLSNWLHDTISCGEATPQEIYDAIRNVVKEEYYYHKDKASKTNELLSLLNGNGSITFTDFSSTLTKDVLDQRNYYEPVSNYTDSAECMKSWSSFWNDDKIKFTSPYVSEDGDKVTKWVLPVELDGLTGECLVTLPDDLLERIGWVEGDTVEFVSNIDGSVTMKKVVKPEVENN